MRKGLLVVGIVLLIIGAALLGLGLSSSISSTVPAGSCLDLTPSSIGSDPVTVSWSGASSTSTVTLSSTSDCSSSTVIASGTGASGSFTATLTSGTTYGITSSSGSPSITVANHGLSLGELLGIVLLIIGILLAIVAVIAKAKPKAAPRESEAQTAGEVSAAATAAGSDVYMAGPDAPGPVAGSRANQVCTYCGATNEAWLTNCRQCKRPLASTGQ